MTGSNDVARFEGGFVVGRVIELRGTHLGCRRVIVLDTAYMPLDVR